MSALHRLWSFNLFHIDINGVNILVSPRHNISRKRECFLIDYGGVFALDFDAKKEKLWTGKSHTYSPFAYYHLYRGQDRESIITESQLSHSNGTTLSELGRKDNEYRVIV